MKNVIQEISVLSRSNVHIKNRDRLNETLNNMTRDGVAKLQVVSDFDKTITKQHKDGVVQLDSLAMFSTIPKNLKNEKYQAKVKSLTKKYYPIELDPHVPVEDKIRHMEEWWNLTEKAMSGLKISQQDIEEMCLAAKISLRDGAGELFKELSDDNVPILVFSSGCGDIVLTILKQCGVYFPNAKVISNFLKYSEDGTIMGFKDKMIHVFNKNEYALKNSDFYDVVADRGNAIVLGDSLGDAKMTQGMEHCENVLKIGFLYDHVEHALPQYMDTFDIVLVDDQTMDVPKAVFDCIRDSSPISQ